MSARSDAVVRRLLGVHAKDGGATQAKAQTKGVASFWLISTVGMPTTTASDSRWQSGFAALRLHLAGPTPCWRGWVWCFYGEQNLALTPKYRINEARHESDLIIESFLRHSLKLVFVPPGCPFVLHQRPVAFQ